MPDPKKFVDAPELDKARQLYAGDAAPTVMVAKKSHSEYTPYLAGLVRRHIHQDPEHSIGKRAAGHAFKGDADQDVEPLERQPIEGDVADGWGINYETGELVPPK